jgi:dCTP diphosphatase
MRTSRRRRRWAASADGRGAGRTSCTQVQPQPTHKVVVAHAWCAGGQAFPLLARVAWNSTVTARQNGAMDAAIDSLTQALRRFAAERDWEQFHSPKNLASALAVEAAELLEPFQWLTEEQSRTLDAARRAAVRDEVADVFLYLLQLADKLDIDVVAAAHEKLALNAQKYPVERSRGSSRKYDGR